MKYDDKTYCLIEQISLPYIIQHADNLEEWLNNLREELHNCFKNNQSSQEYNKSKTQNKNQSIELVTIAQIVDRTGLTDHTVRAMFKSDNPPPYIKTGKKFLVDYYSFCEWFKRQNKARAEYGSTKKSKPAIEPIQENTRNKYSDLVGVRYNARNHRWQAEIRRNYVTYYLGSYDEEENGYEKAKAARLEAERIMALGIDYFKAWYSIKYPQNNPINRAEKGYIK